MTMTMAEDRLTLQQLPDKVSDPDLLRERLNGMTPPLVELRSRT